MTIFPLPASALHVSERINFSQVYSAAVLTLPALEHSDFDDTGTPTDFDLAVTARFHQEWVIRSGTEIIGTIGDEVVLRPLKHLELHATARLSLHDGAIDAALLAPIADWMIARNNANAPVLVGSEYLHVAASRDLTDFGLSHYFAQVSADSPEPHDGGPLTVTVDNEAVGTIAPPDSDSLIKTVKNLPVTVRAYFSEGIMVIAVPQARPQFQTIPPLAVTNDVYSLDGIATPAPRGERVINTSYIS